MQGMAGFTKPIDLLLVSPARLDTLCRALQEEDRRSGLAGNVTAQLGDRSSVLKEWSFSRCLTGRCTLHLPHLSSSWLCGTVTWRGYTASMPYSCEGASFVVSTTWSDRRSCTGHHFGICHEDRSDIICTRGLG